MDELLTRYEQKTLERLKRWELEVLKEPGAFQSLSRSLQSQVNKRIPEKFHQAMTAAVKGIVQTALFSAEYIPESEAVPGSSLEDSDERAVNRLSFYKKLAAAEGAGTGAGGVFLAMVDFPVLIGIKMKCLFELAHTYGYSTRDYRERLFVLHVFQLAFSAHGTKPAILHQVKNWPDTLRSLPADETSYAAHVDWRTLQQEYRDTIDFRKLLQLMPGIGAIIGVWANSGLLEELGQVGMNAYRMRRLLDKLQPQSIDAIVEQPDVL